MQRDAGMGHFYRRTEEDGQEWSTSQRQRAAVRIG